MRVNVTTDNGVIVHFANVYYYYSFKIPTLIDSFSSIIERRLV